MQPFNFFLIVEHIRNALVNHQINEKLDFLRSIIGINTSIVIAVVGLIFLLYQIDKYNKFKKINYFWMLIYSFASLYLGLLFPIIYIHSGGAIEDNNLYIISALSPFLVIIQSAIYLTATLSAMSTTRIIRRFKYRTSVHDTFVKAKIYLMKSWYLLLSKTVERNNKQKRKIDLDIIGRNRNPLAKLADSICLQHGLLMQELEAAQLSPLTTRDDLLVRMVTTAIESDDWRVLRQIVAQYTKLLQKEKKFFQEYTEDIESIGAILIRRGRNDLYDLLIDDLSLAWAKDNQTLNKLKDHVGVLFSAMLYQYIDKGVDAESTQKAVSRLMAFHFLIMTAKNDNRPKDWTYSHDACLRYSQRSVLRIAEKEQEYNLWFMYEKSRYYAHHGAEVKDVYLSVVFMNLISNIGIAGRVYELHCGASECSKSIYDHACEAFEELGGYLTETFSRGDSEQFAKAYKRSFEKLIGYEIKLDLKNKTYKIDKTKPATMQTVRMGPTKSTSDAETIEYNKLNKDSLRRLLNSRKANW